MLIFSKLQIIYVAFWGVLGVLARYFCYVLTSKYLSIDLPIATFSINLMGSFFMGVVYALGIERGVISPEFALALMTGFLGGFTTFSAFSLDALRLFEQQRPLLAFFYITGSGLGGILSASSGLFLVRMILHPK